MDRVEILKNAAESYSVKFLEFTRINSKNHNNFICIFEGEDEKYFSQRITDIISPLMWNGINSGGRKPVLDLYDCISSNPDYKNSNYLCFIDRDFVDWFTNNDPSRIYVTPCYSIENLYYTESSFRRILSSEFKITEFNESRHDFEKCLALFNKEKTEFFEIISIFNYWVKAHRIMERDGKTPRPLNVRNVKISDLISIDLSSVTAVYDMTDPKSVFKDALSISLCPDALKEAQDTLPLPTREQLYRGKQGIDFLRVFLSKLKLDRSSRNPTFFSETGVVRINLSKDNAISELSQYAETPRCLVDFLRSAKGALAA